MVKNSQKMIDSNILVGLFLPGDRLKNRATEAFAKIQREKKKTFIHPLVLMETLSILKYKNSIELAIEIKKIIVKSFLTGRNLGLITERTEVIFEKYPNIGMVDAILIDYCLTNKIELMTLDEKMEKVWKKLKKRDRVN